MRRLESDGVIRVMMCRQPVVKILFAPMFLPKGILHVTCDNTSSRYSVNGGSNGVPGVSVEGGVENA